MGMWLFPTPKQCRHLFLHSKHRWDITRMGEAEWFKCPGVSTTHLRFMRRVAELGVEKSEAIKIEATKIEQLEDEIAELKERLADVKMQLEIANGNVRWLEDQYEPDDARWR